MSFFPSRLCGLAILLVVLPPVAGAQVPPPGLDITLGTSTLRLGAGETAHVAGMVSYRDTAPAVPGAGVTDAQVEIALNVPAGWRVTLSPASTYTLAPGETAAFTITVTAPSAGVGETEARLRVLGTSASGGRSASASAEMGVARLDPASISPFSQGAWGDPVVRAVSLGGSILIVVGLVIAHRRWQASQDRSERINVAGRVPDETTPLVAGSSGLGLALANEPARFGDQREISYRMAVQNATDRSRKVRLDVSDVPKGWRAAFPHDRLSLGPHETHYLTLVVAPGDTVASGERAVVTVRAVAEDAPETGEQTKVHLFAPRSAVPAPRTETPRS